MLTVTFPERSFWGMFRVLREFEGWRCLWRVPVALSTYVVIRGIPVVAAVVIALVAIRGRVLAAGTGAVIALVFDSLGKTLRDRLPWNAAIANRLRTHEQTNPMTNVAVLLRSTDVTTAYRALRRAQFNPQFLSRHVSTPPPDALDLDYEIRVEEPEAWAQSSSDVDRLQRIAAVLARAGLRARVGGIDALPGG